MYSLLAGQSVKLCGFIELLFSGFAGWGLGTCNMPAVHAITTGYALNKVSLSATGAGGDTGTVPDPV